MKWDKNILLMKITFEIIWEIKWFNDQFRSLLEMLQWEKMMQATHVVSVVIMLLGHTLSVG